MKKNTIDSWFKNNRLPRVDDAYAIADALDVSLEFLMTGKDPEVQIENPDIQDICSFLNTRTESEVLIAKGMLMSMPYFDLLRSQRRQAKTTGEREAASG